MKRILNEEMQSVQPNSMKSLNPKCQEIVSQLSQVYF